MATQGAVLEEIRTALPSRAELHHASTPVTRVAVRLLGDFEVRVDGRAVAWQTLDPAAQRRTGRASHWPLAGACTVSRSSMPCGRTWTSRPPHRACTRQRTTPAPPSETATPSSSALRPSACTPVSRSTSTPAWFQQTAQSALDSGRVAAAKAALALHAGVLLPHDLYEPWVERHRLHLGRLLRELLHQAEDWHQALAADPSDETAHLALARRHANDGDLAAALRQLDELLDRVLRLEASGLGPTSAGSGASTAHRRRGSGATVLLGLAARGVGTEVTLGGDQRDWPAHRHGARLNMERCVA